MQVIINFNLFAMKTLLLSLVFSFLSFILFGQNLQRSTLSSSGDSNTIEVTGKTYYISQSISQQSVIGTLQANNTSIRQGFQQPPLSINVLINENTTLDAHIYPNPADYFITVLFSNKVENPIQIELYDIVGKHILSKEEKPTNKFQIDIAHLPSGTYLLNLFSGSKKLTAKLIKK